MHIQLLVNRQFGINNATQYIVAPQYGDLAWFKVKITKFSHFLSIFGSIFYAEPFQFYLESLIHSKKKSRVKPLSLKKQMVNVTMSIGNWVNKKVNFFLNWIKATKYSRLLYSRPDAFVERALSVCTDHAREVTHVHSVSINVTMFENRRVLHESHFEIHSEKNFVMGFLSENVI